MPCSQDFMYWCIWGLSLWTLKIEHTHWCFGKDFSSEQVLPSLLPAVQQSPLDAKGGRYSTLSQISPWPKKDVWKMHSYGTVPKRL